VAAQAAAQLPRHVNPCLELVYRRQGSGGGHAGADGGVSRSAGSIIGVSKFKQNTAHMQMCVLRALLVSSGTEAGRPVPSSEWHKCRYCAYVQECGEHSPMVAKLGAPPPDWVPDGHEGAVAIHTKRPRDALGTFRDDPLSPPLTGSSGQSLLVTEQGGDSESAWEAAALAAVVSAEQGAAE
jgi:hypothetical protein